MSRPKVSQEFHLTVQRNSRLKGGNKLRYLTPYLIGDPWLIGPRPDLPTNMLKTNELGQPLHECVDHHLFQDIDGIWHLWGCIRNLAIGRILYHWSSNDLFSSDWVKTGEYFRIDQSHGESLRDWGEEEWIQSPYVVQNNGSYYMFYGGHSTGANSDGIDVETDDFSVACQMCLMRSKDGKEWVRHDDGKGLSRIFVGPGETRDPCVIRYGNKWLMYFAGYHDEIRTNPGIYVRESVDLVDWSHWKLVHQDFQYGEGAWGHECPFVIEKNGGYYLFRTEHYSSARTHVFHSLDPFNFGVGDASSKYVGSISVAAPEIITTGDGEELITSNHELTKGTLISKLGWK